MDKLSSSSVLITGAASGIGAATIAKYMANTDMQIIAVDINQVGLAELFSAYDESQQTRLKCIPLDLTDKVTVEQDLISLISQQGGVDHVIISHAVAYNNHINENEKWDKIIDVNLLATQRLFACLNDLIKDEGRVVVLSSILGRVGKASNTAYVTSKHALLGLVKALALDWATRKITVNAVLPCWVDTEMLHTELQQQADLIGSSVKQMLRKVKKQIPLRALVSADNVADSVLFLTSPQAKLITAQSLVIDGGFSCGA